MSADMSVFMAVCPTVGSERVAVAHKESIVVTTGASTIAIPTTQPARALGFVPIAAAAAQQTAAKSTVEGVVVTGDSSAAPANASSYLVTGGDDKALNLLFINGSAVTVADTHGPVGKKVSHLLVVPTVSSASTLPFAALVAKPPTGRAPYATNPDAGFATRDAPSVAVADKDDEEHDDNNVKASGLSAKDAYAVAAGRYYPNQVANVVFANKFGEVYVIALLQTATGIVFGPAPVFLLQHFAVVSAVSIVGYNKGEAKTSANGRLITCDRDAHVRVSRYPAAFDIEQFLWAKHTPLPKTATEEEKATQKPSQVTVPVVVGTTDAKTLFTGDASGRVTQWKSAGADVQQPWAIASVAELTAEQAATAALETSPTNYGGVVGMALLNHEATLLVARDHINTITVIDVAAAAGASSSSSAAAEKTIAVPNNSVVIQMVATADGKSAVALLRDGSLHLIDATALTTTQLVANVAPAASLGIVDLYYAWKSQFAENKTRREEERALADERNKVNPKTNNNRKKLGDSNKTAVNFGRVETAAAAVAAAPAAEEPKQE